MGLKSRQQVLRERAANGALNFSSEKLTSRVVAISCALADRFQLQFHPTDPVVEPSTTTLEDVAHIVCQGLLADRTVTTRRTVQPENLRAARAALVEISGFDVTEARLDRSLDSLIPTFQRRAVRQRLEQALHITLPKLGANRPAKGVAIVLGIAMTYAIVVPLAEWADQEHPIHDPPFLVAIAAKILVRGGFFVLLIVLIALLRRLAALLFPGFSDGCSTIAELSLFVDDEIHGRAWTLDEISAELRDVVAKADRIPLSTVTMERRLGD